MKSIENEQDDLFHGSEVVEIPIELIDDVDRNPRFRQDDVLFNENAVDIRESMLRAKGEYLVLHVVKSQKSPGRYGLFRGGSTRLQIARELNLQANKEGVDSNFKYIKCIVYPHIEKSEKLLSTVTENIARGELCYGEKAEALQLSLEAYRLVLGDEREIVADEIVKYLSENGARALAATKQEVGYLIGCREHFILKGVLVKKIVDGRANREFVRCALGLRSLFLNEYKSREREASEEEWESICVEVDATDLEFRTLHKAVLDHLNSVFPEEAKTSTENRFLRKYNLPSGDSGEHLTSDSEKNVMLFFSEFATTGSYVSTKKKTHKLKAMGVENDFEGFLKLLGKLPVPARKLAMTEILKSLNDNP